MTNPNITAESLLRAAHERGIPAFDAPPCPFLPTKILLASIADVADPEVQSRLLALHRTGAITLARIDLAAAVPADRRDLLERSAIRHLGAQFDAMAIGGGAP
jgi:hypothetical protein